jgi:hypothetical protein
MPARRRKERSHATTTPHGSPARCADPRGADPVRRCRTPRRPVCAALNPNRGVNIAYSCDTTGGKSGFPVLAGSTHWVVALHHLGSYPANNAGVKIGLIYPEIADMTDNAG